MKQTNEEKFPMTSSSGLEVKQCSFEHLNFRYVPAEAVERYFQMKALLPMETFSKRELAAFMILQGYLSSGRKETVVDGRNTPVEVAALVHTDRMFAELCKDPIK